MQKKSITAKDFDIIFPGENWFLYWKTSSTLWEAKLAEIGRGKRIIIPINWALHHAELGKYDFATKKPETDLAKLNRVAIKLGHLPQFLCPLTPAPFIQNGGVPHEVATTKATDPNGLMYTTVDPENSIFHLYSFFDPKVYKSFQSFVSALAKYFEAEKISSPVWGGVYGYFQDGQFYSYLHDRSKLFHTSFARFISIKKKNIPVDETFPRSQEEELALIHEFTATMQELYVGTCQESLSSNWEGPINVAFLGASPNDTFNRVTRSDNTIDHSRTLFDMATRDIIPSSILISASHKTGVLKLELDEIVSNTLIPAAFHSSVSDDDNTEYSGPLKLFTLFDFASILEPGSDAKLTWIKTGLLEHLKKEYPWSYILKNSYQNDSNTEDYSSVYCFSGKDINEKIYKNIIKFLMNGGRIILDTAELDSNIKRKIESFFIENSINTTSLFFHCDIKHASLGDGKMILFDGAVLSTKQSDKKNEFWTKLITTLSVIHLPIKYGPDICFFWRKRFDNTNELNYEEVRKLNLYNPSSYKQYVQLPMINNFVLIKAGTPKYSSFTTARNEINVELLPGGSIDLDFGIYSP